MSDTRTGASYELRIVEVVLVLLGVHAASVSTTHKKHLKSKDARHPFYFKNRKIMIEASSIFLSGIEPETLN